jgi:hypothetical protein
MNTKWIVVAITLILLCACEESLPPRIPPDPGEVLESSFSAIDGGVFFERRATVSQSVSGSFQIEVKNKHDEFLSGRENIRIEIEMWRVGRPATIYKISGDRNSLINQYDLQGRAFLLDGDVLSLAPDSSAKFLIGLDHVGLGLYHDAGARFEIPQGPWWPHVGAHVVTDQISLRARGTVQVWEAQRTPQLMEETQFSIFYFFDTGVASVRIFDLVSSVDSITHFVSLGWNTFLHVGVERYEIQRATSPSNNFIHLTYIAPEGGLYDTTSYLYVDSNAPSGVLSYRLGMWEKPFLFARPLLAYYLSFPDVFVP